MPKNIKIIINNYWIDNKALLLIILIVYYIYHLIFLQPDFINKKFEIKELILK